MATYPASDYPGASDTDIPTVTSGDDLDTVGKEHSVLHNALRNSILAVQGELGMDPAGAYATVKARLAALDGRVFDAVAYGAVVDGSTDDTAAWQAAIDACAAAGGGVVTSSKNGVSVISGALQDTSGANAQLLLPAIDYVDTEAVSVTLAGLTPPPGIVSVIGATPIPDGHLVLKSTLASGTGAVIGAKGPVGTTAGFTNLNLRVENLTVRTVANPTNTALDLRRVATVDLEHVVVDGGSYYVQGLTEPTTSTSFAIRCPGNDNGAHTRLQSVDVIGFYNGYEFSEHTRGDGVTAWGCKVAATFVAANHASSFDRFMAVHCERVLKFTGAHAVDFWQLNIEHAASGWWVTDYDIDDASNYGSGFVRWWAVLAGTGAHNSFTVNSATGMTTSRVGAAIGSGGSSGISIQDENGTAITGVTQLDFQGAGVSAASGTGEVVVTIPGGSGYVYRDRLVATAGQNTLTLGATPVANSPLVWVNGTIKWPTTDYTVASNVLTFVSALSASDVVAVQYHSAASSASASALSTTGGVNILDDFNRSDASSLGTTSTGSKTWTSSNFGITSNRAQIKGSPGDGVRIAYVDSAVADCTVSVKLGVISAATDFYGPFVRHDGSGNGYLIQVNGPASTIDIEKRTSGANTVIGTGVSYTPTAGDVISVVLLGTSITVKVNGVTKVTATDSTYQTATRHGFWAYVSAGPTHFDDFSIQP